VDAAKRFDEDMMGIWRALTGAASKTIPASRMVRSDQEFLPAALAILETPPSPVRITLLWTICLLLTVAIAWSYFGRIDILATAQGKIQPTGRVKTIQPLETGKVVALHVENGQHVAAGDVLIELDRTEAFADEAGVIASLAAFRGEQLRRLSALEAAGDREHPLAAPNVVWPTDIPAKVRAREERVLKGDLQQLKGAMQSLDAQIVQKKEEEKRLRNTISAQENLIRTLQQRVAMRKELSSRGSAPKASVIDAMETLQYQQTQLASQEGQLIEARAAAEVLAKERQKTIDAFIAENGQKLAEAGRQIDDLEQRAAKARAKNRPYDAGQPNFGNGAWTLGHHQEPGFDDQRGAHAHRSRRRRARNRELRAEQGYRLHPCGPDGGRENRILSLHPLWLDRCARHPRRP
jgi:hemolysin D